jgi:TPR repeat protein
MLDQVSVLHHCVNSKILITPDSGGRRSTAAKTRGTEVRSHSTMGQRWRVPGISAKSFSTKPARVVLLLATFTLIACATVHGASFSLAENQCVANLDECKRRCSGSPRDREACDVLTVRIAEALVEDGDAPSKDPAWLASLDHELNALCKYSIGRACAARQQLAPSLEEAVAQVAANRPDAAPGRATFAERLDAAERRTQELLGELGVEVSCRSTDPFSSCYRGHDVTRIVSQAKRCTQDSAGRVADVCADLLRTAEQHVMALERELNERQVKAEQQVALEEALTNASEAAQREDETERAAMASAASACAQDGPECRTTCSNDPSAGSCIGVAAQALTAGDYKSGYDQMLRSCHANNKLACSVAQKIMINATRCATVEECQPFCNGGLSIACMQAGRVAGKVGADAAPFHERACAIGDPNGCALAGHYEKARGMADKGCKNGDSTACATLQQFDKLAGECEDVQECRVLCDARFGDACGQLGDIYFDGLDVRKNVSTAIDLWKKGCELGSPGSCNALGAQYFDGNGVPRDRKTAERYFDKACDAYEPRVQAAAGRDPLLAHHAEAACRNAGGTSCVRRVQAPANRRPDLDEKCRARGLPASAWSTLTGEDHDECLNSMMNRGCTEAMGLRAYCCPDN